MMDKIPKVRLKPRVGFKTINYSNKKLNMLFPIILLLGTTACATTDRSKNNSNVKVSAPELTKVVEVPDTQSIDSLAPNPPSSDTPMIYEGPTGVTSNSSETSPHDSAKKELQTIIPVTQQKTETLQNTAPITTQVEQNSQSPASVVVGEMTGGSSTEIVEDITGTQGINVDISEQYTDYDGPVPVIRDPKSCGTNKYEIRVDVVNVAKEKGIINVDLHDDVQENFLVGAKAVLRIWATAHKGQTTFCIPLSKPGEYAVAIYHDKNSNHKFDKNFLGIPKERFGMSNNPRFGTKSPKYNKAVFTVPEEGVHITIKLRKASDILGRQK